MTATRRSVALAVAAVATAAAATLLIFSGHTREAGAEEAPSTATRAAAAPETPAFAKIGIGACADAKVEKVVKVVPVAAPAGDSCAPVAPVAHDVDLASLSVDQTVSADEPVERF